MEARERKIAESLKRLSNYTSTVLRLKKRVPSDSETRGTKDEVYLSLIWSNKEIKPGRAINSNTINTEIRKRIASPPTDSKGAKWNCLSN